MEFGQEVLPQQVGGVALMEKVGELHPSWRRWAGSASPHMTSLGGSQIQEAVSKGGEQRPGGSGMDRGIRSKIEQMSKDIRQILTYMSPE